MRINYVKEIDENLREINKILNRDLKREMIRLDLGLSHFYILTTLYREKVLSSGNLAKSLDVRNSTITSLVDRLVKLSLVKRRRDERDRRVVLVELTDKGKKLTEKLLTLRKERLKEIVKELPEEKVKEIYESIKRVKEILKKK
ncbi:MAG: MarR family transcriptional regulator [Caldisericia bacterium]|nr:MarR family transcriptional regulator [Caldisericia bacterium]